LAIDLTQPFTTADVANLLASQSDTQNWQLRVTSTGIADLSSTVGASNIAGLAFRLETWLAGNGYVGAKAAADPSFVARIEKVLRANWPNPSSTYIDLF
jgi:hypothetical protein